MDTGSLGFWGRVCPSSFGAYYYGTAEKGQSLETPLWQKQFQAGLGVNVPFARNTVLHRRCANV
jgi:hypothetical protein